GQEFVADVGGGDAGDLGVVVGGRDLHDVGADQVERGERAQRGQQFPAGQAPASGVPVPGACAGSSTSMSTETYTGRSPTRAAIRSIRPVTPRCSTSGAETTWKPSSESSVRSASVYSGPRMPACRQPVRSKRPSSDARRNGVPCVYAAPKYVSQVSRCASKWTTATGPC